MEELIMPIETNRLKIPLPLGNESVSRVGINAIFEKIDDGVATREDVEELRQLVNEMDIPDASLTQKGKVILSSKTNGDRDDIAATEKAVKDALQEAKDATILKSGGSFNGIVEAQSNTSYTARQIRNMILSTASPNVNAMQDGDIWIKYK